MTMTASVVGVNASTTRRTRCVRRATITTRATPTNASDDNTKGIVAMATAVALAVNTYGVNEAFAAGTSAELDVEALYTKVAPEKPKAGRLSGLTEIPKEASKAAPAVAAAKAPVAPKTAETKKVKKAAPVIELPTQPTLTPTAKPAKSAPTAKRESVTAPAAPEPKVVGKFKPSTAAVTKPVGTTRAKSKAQANVTLSPKEKLENKKAKEAKKFKPKPKPAKSKRFSKKSSAPKITTKRVAPPAPRKKKTSTFDASTLAGALLALGLYGLTSKSSGGSSSTKTSSPSTVSAAHKASTSSPNARAAEAQAWIDAWKRRSSGADTPEGRAKEAAEWIAAWEKNNKKGAWWSW